MAAVMQRLRRALFPPPGCHWCGQESSGPCPSCTLPRCAEHTGPEKGFCATCHGDDQAASELAAWLQPRVEAYQAAGRKQQPCICPCPCPVCGDGSTGQPCDCQCCDAACGGY